MEASGDKAMEGGGDAVGFEHDANRKPSRKVGRRRTDFLDWFIVRDMFDRDLK
jgi:hypothetical protein